MKPPNNRKSRLRDNPLNRCEILRECHLANDEFCREFEAVCKPVIAAGCFSCSGGILIGLDVAEVKQAGEESLREGVRRTEESIKLLHDLIKKWPHTAWLFFPEDGYAGFIRLIRQFYSRVYFSLFPEDRDKVQFKLSYRVTGNRWCGTPERLRLSETTRALNMWKEFKDGRSPIEIARREMTRERGPRKSLHTVLVQVSRSLQRAHILIYGGPLSINRRERRLGDFDMAMHMEKCRRCNTGKLCQAAEDFANLDYVSLRESLGGG
jgi:hypothetical protein